jgi:hypothetical protein
MRDDAVDLCPAKQTSKQTNTRQLTATARGQSRICFLGLLIHLSTHDFNLLYEIINVSFVNVCSAESVNWSTNEPSA